MKQVVLDMKKFKLLTVILTLALSTNIANGQYQYEREHRIKKCQFPSNAHTFLEDKLKDPKNMRFYGEKDSLKVSYEAKFKIDKLNYSIEFDEKGEPEDIEILIKEVDVPNDSWSKITSYLEQEDFEKYKVKIIQQQYASTTQESVDKTLDDAFQNLLLPTVNYKLMVRGKKENGNEDYNYWFSADGNFIESKKSLPFNYAHVLY